MQLVAAILDWTGLEHRTVSHNHMKKTCLKTQQKLGTGHKWAGCSGGKLND